MKNLIQITAVLFLFVQTIGYGQTKNTEANSKKQDTISKRQDTKSEIDTTKLKSFIGKYLLEEANFTLEIAKENGLMYIITPFSKDLLILKNETTLREMTRGVDLELIEGNPDALKFTQNGYETIIERVKPKTEE